MKKLLLVVFFLIFCSYLKCFSSTSVSGNISSNTTWTKAQSPYILTGNVGIPAAYTLTVEPGVVIQRAADYQILINGSVQIRGTATDSIVFVTNNLTISNSYFIEFQKSSLNNSSLRFITFHNQVGGSNNVRIGNESEFTQTTPKNSGTLLISRSNLSNGYTATKGYMAATSLNIDSSLIISANIVGYYPRSEAVKITNSIIYSSTLNSDSYNSGFTLNNDLIKGSILAIGCCGANFSVSNCQLEDSKFNRGGGSPIAGPVNIENSILLNTVINTAEAAYQISNSRFIINKNPLNLSPSGVAYVIEAGNLQMTNSEIVNQSIYRYEGVRLSGYNGYTVAGNNTFINNTFSNLYNAITVTDFSSISINSNNFLKTTVYAITNNSNKDFVATGNFFSLNASQTINDAIFDGNDDLRYGLVTLSNNASDLTPNSPVAEPANVFKSTSAHGVLVTWAKNKEANIKNYKIYWGFINSTTYANSVTVEPTATTYEINGASITDSIAVTAINTNATGNNDQRNGSESWYSPARLIKASISFFTPTIGSTGSMITITGTNLTDITDVSFGGVSATSIKILSSTQLVAYVGTGASGNVVISNSAGRSVLAGFTFVPPPAITSFTPQLATDGATISISGTNLGNTLGVTVGGTRVSSFVIKSASEILVVLAPGTKSGSIVIDHNYGTVSVPGFTVAERAKISYRSPVSFLLNEQAASLTPQNDGGAIPADGNVITMSLAGLNGTGYADGSGAAARFSNPSGIVVDNSGNMYVADTYNQRIRKITPDWKVTTLAGNGTAGSADGAGLVSAFNFPVGIAIDNIGNLYVADKDNNKIRKVSTTGIVTTFAGSGSVGSANGTGTAASFYKPQGITIDGSGNLYVTDSYNNKIRKITAAGVVTTLAGNGSTGLNDGAGASATFNQPRGITIDAAGNLYIADYQNNAVRKVAQDGTVSTVFKTGTDYANGFYLPHSVTIDPVGNLYVADQSNNVIRKLSLAGVVSNLPGFNPAASASTSFFSNGLTYALNKLYVIDQGQVRNLIFPGYSVSPALPTGLSLNAKTGVISGTPTELVNNKDYTVTGYNAAGANTTGINITVANDVTPVISFSEIPSAIYGDADITLNAVSTYNGIGINYATNNDQVAVIKNGKLHIVNVGTVTITASQPAATHVSGATATRVFTVAPRPITIKADSVDKIYGQADPIFTYQIKAGSLVSGDSFNGTLTRTSGENVGFYAINQGSLTLGNNYILSYIPGSLYIATRSITITPDSLSKTYGDNDPEFTYKISSGQLVNNDQLTGKLERAPGENIGTYIINKGSLAVSSNYKPTFLTASFRIQKKKLMVKALDTEWDYGGAHITNLAVQYNGFAFADDVRSLKQAPTAATAAVITSPAGTYDITPSGGEADNYTFAYEKGTLTIKRAPLTITADDNTRSAGKSNPAFTVTYAGFVNGDDEGKLTTKPTITTTATAASAAGIYDLVPGGASSTNYDFTYKNGKLTITPAVTNFKVAATNVSCKGQNNGAITITATDSHNYAAILTGSGVNKTQTFTSSLNFDNLAPGSYNLCITDAALPAYNQCFDLTITEPKDLAMYATVNKTTNMANLLLDGGTSYNIEVNGIRYRATGKSFTIPLTRGSNRITVTTDLYCQGKVEEIINLGGNPAPYPNPFTNELYINLGDVIISKASLKLYGLNDGLLKTSSEYTNITGVVKLNLQQLPMGFYTLHVITDGKETIYKVIKQ